MNKTVPDELGREKLESLVGAPLWDLSFAADMAMFSFGARLKGPGPKGSTVERGEQALHVLADWRLIKGAHLLVGSRDLPGGSGPIDDSEPWASALSIIRSSLRVRHVKLEGVGLLRVGLEEDVRLEVFPDFGGGGQVDQEYWRYFHPSRSDPHVVFSGTGFSLD